MAANNTILLSVPSQKLLVPVAQPSSCSREALEIQLIRNVRIPNMKAISAILLHPFLQSAVVGKDSGQALSARQCHKDTFSLLENPGASCPALHDDMN